MKAITKNLKRIQVKSNNQTVVKKHEIIHVKENVTVQYICELFENLNATPSYSCRRFTNDLKKDNHITFSKMMSGTQAWYKTQLPTMKDFESCYIINVFNYNLFNPKERIGINISYSNLHFYDLSKKCNWHLHNEEGIYGYPEVWKFFILPKSFNIKLTEIWENGIMRKEYDFIKK